MLLLLLLSLNSKSMEQHLSLAIRGSCCANVVLGRCYAMA